eukprot:GEMP01050074.1.p1 GENE.GEMP01050074.1~~GEMP01050074.1.p1  ORF type:complete len:358 (+),score=100.04 GEMP01050074.1:25-1074(+)
MSDFKKLVKALDAPTEGLERLKTLESFTDSVERMKERAFARLRLDIVKETLASYGVSPDLPDLEDMIPTLEAKPAECVKEICRLQVIATYGPAMAQKVIDACSRFDTALAEIRSACDGMEVDAPANDAEPVDDSPNPHELFAQQIAAKEALKEEDRKRVVEATAHAEKLEREAKLVAEREEQILQEQRDLEEKRIDAMSLVDRLTAGYEDLLRLPVSLFIQVLSSLERIIAQVVEHPELPKCIGLNNPAFFQDVGCHPGTVTFLRGVGFQKRLAAEIPPGLVKAAPTEPFLFLPEPDMIADFDCWKRWEGRLKEVVNRLRLALAQLRGRPTHLGDQLAAHGVPSIDWNC